MYKTDEIKQRVLAEYKAGEKATDLAMKYGISRGTIYLWIKNEKDGKLLFTEEQFEEEKDYCQNKHDLSLLEQLKEKNVEIQRLKEEVELYKSLLVKLNKLIDNSN